MLSFRSNRIKGLLLASVLGTGLCAGPALAGDSSTEKLVLADSVSQKQFTEGLTLLGQGQLDEGGQLIRKVASTTNGNESLRRIVGWLDEFDTLQKERISLIDADYETYVSWINEDKREFTEGEQKGKRGWWRIASLDAAKAFASSRDEDAVRESAWIKDVVAGALTAADQYEADGEWLEAATIYARLSDIFPLNKDYRDGLKRCQSHIRIELTYTPKSEWQNEVREVVSEMAVDALRKVRGEHLKEADFKSMAVEGLRQVIRMAEEPPAEVFEALGDQDLVDEFLARVGVHLKRALNSEELDVGDVIDALKTVLRINKELKLLPDNVLVYEFMQGALQPMDQFTDMIWPAAKAEFEKHTSGKFSGVGIQIRKAAGDPILVISPLKDSPAYEKGIRPGDMITKINGEDAKGYTISRAVREITGRIGTPVRLTMKRGEHGKEFEVELIRREIKISTIRGIERKSDGDWEFMIDPDSKIAYTRLTNFTDECVEELSDVLRTLEEQGMRGLIFDLRGNPGGPLRAAVGISDMFLSGKKRIVSTRGRRAQPWQVDSTEEFDFSDFPLIVLINPSSASASEIVAGALQVHQRALIVGERSFGKGSVQQVFPLNNARSAFLKLTTSLYYLPNDVCLHRDEDSETWGVDPDVEVKLTPKEYVKISQLQLKAEILKGKNQEDLTDEDVKSLTEYKSTTKPADGEDEEAIEGEEHAEDDEASEHEPKITRVDENNFPEIDPQLEAALLLMRIRLESGEPWRPAHTEMAAKPTETTGG